MAPTINVDSIIHGGLGELYITVNNKRYSLANAINVSAQIDKNKVAVPILGKIMQANKSAGASGSGTMTLHYNTSVLRKLMINYIKTGRDFNATLQITNNDPSTKIGRQTTILYGVNFDSMIIAQLDTEADYLQEDIAFTFDDADLPQSFSALAEMN